MASASRACSACNGCHGRELQGEPFYEVYASNLTRDVGKYSDAQLERLLRRGDRTDGRDLWAMPSEIFQQLSEPAMTSLVAYLRTLQPAGKPTPPLPAFGDDVRKLIAAGTLKPAAQWVSETRAIKPMDRGPRHALGRYITMVTCAECHGADLKGQERETPDLIVAGAYSRKEFETLMTNGMPNGPRKLDLMAAVAKGRSCQMTKTERDALYDDLPARAGQLR